MTPRGAGSARNSTAETIGQARGMRMRILHAAGPEWRLLAKRIGKMVEAEGFEVLKTTVQTRAGFLACEGANAFIKRVQNGSYAKGIVARIFGSRAMRARRGAELLAAGNFAHPRPLLIAEEISMGAIRASYIATEPLHDARVFSRFALGPSRTPPCRRAISKRVAGEIRRLHDAGIYTRDLQETNLMLQAQGSALTVWFLDFEDYRRARRVSARRRMLNLVHLDRSIGRFASRAKRLRFFYDYFGAKPRREEARWLIREYAAARSRVETGGRRPLPIDPAVTMSPAASEMSGQKQS